MNTLMLGSGSQELSLTSSKSCSSKFVFAFLIYFLVVIICSSNVTQSGNGNLACKYCTLSWRLHQNTKLLKLKIIFIAKKAIFNSFIIMYDVTISWLLPDAFLKQIEKNSFFAIKRFYLDVVFTHHQWKIYVLFWLHCTLTTEMSL